MEYYYFRQLNSLDTKIVNFSNTKYTNCPILGNDMNYGHSITSMVCYLVIRSPENPILHTERSHLFIYLLFVAFKQ